MLMTHANLFRHSPPTHTSNSPGSTAQVLLRPKNANSSLLSTNSTRFDWPTLRFTTLELL